MGNGSRPVYRVVTGIRSPYVMYNRGSNAFCGYCIDLLNDIGSLADFDYAVGESLDQRYGYQDPSAGHRNGMIYELMKNRSDIAAGPLWIAFNKAQVSINFFWAGE